MLRDGFSSRWFIGGIVFFVLCVGGSLLYSWYFRLETRDILSKHNPIVPQITGTDKDTRTVQDAGTAIDADETSDTQMESADAETLQWNSNAEKSELPRIGEMVNGRIFLGTQPPSLELLSQFQPEDQIISPYGFGPYPALPEGFGPITWPRKNAESELMIRVQVKLLKQGVPVKGIVANREKGTVYPIIKGVRYVTYGETSYGRRYIKRSLGHPDDTEYMKIITDEKRHRRESVTPADFSGMELIPYEEGGIDPYTFLDLPK